MHVLVVDDEAWIRKLMAELCRVASPECATGSNGAETLAYVRTSPVDVVVTDLNMPGMSGMALAKTLRASSPDTTLLCFTGSAPDEDTRQELRRLFAAVLFKPQDVSRVIGEVMRRLAGERQLG